LAEYTKLDNTQITSILAQYSLGSLLTSTVLNGGSENTNYKIHTSQGDFVLTLCERKTLDEAQQLTDLLVHLGLNNFATSKVLSSNDGDRVVVWEGKPVMIKNHLPGSIRKKIPEQKLISLGQQLAKLHLIKPPDYLKHKLTFGKESFKQIEIYDNNSDFQRWLYSIRSDIHEHVKKDLPKALIHGDVFFNNVIIDEDNASATIMDFEEACYYYRVFDIGMMLVGLCEESEKLKLSSAQPILAGYQQISQLHENEKQALQCFSAYAAASTAFWRHQHYRHVMPNPTLQDHYLSMQHLGDDILEIPKQEFRNILENGA